MATHVVFESDWHRHIGGEVSDLLERLGAEITADAKIACPVETGRLRDSLDYEVRGATLNVGTNVDYAVYVEEGTRYMNAEPFLRPALYRVRGR